MKKNVWIKTMQFDDLDPCPLGSTFLQENNSSLPLQNCLVLTGFKISQSDILSHKIRDFIPFVRNVFGLFKSFSQNFQSQDLLIGITHPGMVVHACNHRYQGGKGRKILSWMAAQADSETPSQKQKGQEWLKWQITYLACERP